MIVLVRVFGSFAGIIGMLSVWFFFSSCTSTPLSPLPSFSTSKPENYPIYEVMTQGAPFYLKYSPEGMGRGKTHPYLYLGKGTAVALLKTGNRYSQVSLTNGMKGWMPASAVAPQMAPSEVAPSAVTPVASDTQGPSGINPEAGVKLPSY